MFLTGKPNSDPARHVTISHTSLYLPGSLGMVVESCADMVPSNRQHRYIGLQARQHNLHLRLQLLKEF